VPRAPRLSPPGVTVEAMTRTTQGRYLLRPSPELNEIMLGILGRALALFPVELHAYTVLSNHYHMLLTPPDAEVLASFMGYLNREISRRIGTLHDWPGGIWQRRYDSTPILGEAAMVARLRYVVSQGVKEGLVEKALDWPGISSTQSLLDGTVVEARWLDIDAYHRARRRDPSASRDDFIHVFPIELAPLPCWAHLSPESHRRACADLVDDIESEAAADRQQRGVGVLGAACVCAQDPHHRPPRLESTPAPVVHASSIEHRQLFLALRREFINAYRVGATKLRDGERDVRFPAHSFPCPGRFVLEEPRFVKAFQLLRTQRRGYG